MARSPSSPIILPCPAKLQKNVSHAYKSKETPFDTTQQSTRQAPSSSTQTQVEFKLSSSWTQVELQSRRRRKPAEKSVGVSGKSVWVSGKVGGGRRKSRWGETKKSGRQTKKSSGRSVAGGWTGEIGLVENRSQACGESFPGLWRFPFGLWFGAHGAVPELNLN